MLVLRKETPEEYLADIRKQGAQNAKNHFGVPTLCSAIQKFRSAYLVEKLLKDGAIIDQFTCIKRLSPDTITRDRFKLWGQYTAIHEAVAVGRCEIVNLLLSHGADLSTKTTKGVECLHYICDPYYRCQTDETRITEKDDLEILKTMNCNGVDLSKKHNFSQTTVLHKATVTGCTEIVKYLLSVGFDANCVDAFGSTPLHHCKWNNMEVANVLLQNNADPNAQDETGNTLYHRVLAQFGYGKTTKDLTDILCLLHKFNANPNVQNENGETALHVCLVNIYSRNSDQQELVNLMLTQGADPNIEDIFERTPVYYLAVILKKDDPRVLGLVWSLLTKLIHFGAKLNHLDITGTPLLHVLVDGLILYPEHFDASLWIDILHPKCEVNLNVQDYCNRTVLHLVAAKGDWHLGMLFLKHGGNLDTMDCDGNTPLDVAILCKRWEFARNLVLWPMRFEYSESNESNCSGRNHDSNRNNITNNNHDCNREKSFGGLKKLKRSSSMPSFKTNKKNEESFTSLGLNANWTKDKLDTVARFVAKVGNEFYYTFRKHDPIFWEADLCPEPKISRRFSSQISKCSLRRLCEENSLEFHLTKTCGEEHCLLAQEVFNLVKDLVTKCSKIDPRMKSKLYLTGSSSEGTKMWFPDEFDFSMELVELRNCCYIEDSLKSPANVTLLGQKCQKAWSNLCHREFVLSSVELKKYLSILLWKAAFNLNRQKYPNIHFNLCRYDGNSRDRNYDSFLNDTKVGVNLTIRWNGCKYKNLTVSVDLTPVIPVVISERQMRDFNEFAKKELVADKYIHVVPYLRHNENVCWRTSFSLIEVRIMKSLTKKQISLYKCLKFLRDLHEDILSHIPSYYLKTFLLTTFYQNTNDRDFTEDEDFYTSASRVILSLKHIADLDDRVIQHFFLNMPLRLLDYDMRWCESILNHLQSN